LKLPADTSLTLRRSHQCFRGWGNYIAIAAPSCVMVCMEWWSVECIVMLAGLLRHPSLSVAVTGICLNLMALVYMMSFGFSGTP
jgi:multidrug resistance protein, MATE family